MNINRLVVTIEPWQYAYPSKPDVRILKIKVERWPGEDVQLERVMYNDDLLSTWDHVWEAAEIEIKRVLSEQAQP